MDNTSDYRTRVRKPSVRILLKAIVAVFLIAFLLPVILGKTFLRDLVLNSLLDSDNLTLQSSDASLGYFSPASVSGVILQTIDESATVQFQEVVADRSWVSMLLSRPNLGDFRFVRPEVEVAILGSEREGSSGATKDGGVVAAPLLPTLSADIVDAHLVLRTLADEPPPIDIKGINARVQLKRRDNLSIFILEPAVVFDRQPLTPELCGRGLQLIAPLLADEVSATGEFSLSLTKCEIPVRTTSLEPGVKAHAIEINGKLDLHNATVAMNNTLASKTLGMVIKLAGITLPGKLTVAENVTVQFSVMDGRVHHSGLALILPHGERSIEIVSSGSVGLDETLDLSVSINVPEGLLGKGVVRDALTSQPIQLAVTGTFAQPKIKIAGERGFLNSIGGLIDSAAKEAGENKPAEVGAAVSNLLGDVWELAQERKKSKKQAESQSPVGEQSQNPNAERTPLLPRFRDKGRGLLPRRGKSEQPDSPAVTPQVEHGFPE